MAIYQVSLMFTGYIREEGVEANSEAEAIQKVRGQYDGYEVKDLTDIDREPDADIAEEMG